MKIKLDHDISSPTLKEAIASFGHDVMTADEEGLARVHDYFLFAAVIREQRLLLTLDKGFTNTRLYPPQTHAGVIWFEQEKHLTYKRLFRRIVGFMRSHRLDGFHKRTLMVERTRARIKNPSARVVVHLNVENRAACNAKSHTLFLSDEIDAVTCRRCLRRG